MAGGFSSIYMSRNRVRGWNEQSSPIQAGGRHAPCHPQASKMIKIEKDKMVFDPNTKILIEDFLLENVQEYKLSLMILFFIMII
jgi:hypothetical protein